MLQEKLKGIERLISTKITNCPELSSWLIAIGLTKEFREDVLELFQTVEQLRYDSQQSVRLLQKSDQGCL